MNDHDHESGEAQDHEYRLCPADAEALDAMLEFGLDDASVSEPHRRRAGQIGRLFALLGAGKVSGRSERVSRVVGAVARPRPDAAIELCGDDAEALDAWVLAGFESSRVPAALRHRAQAHAALADMVASGGPRISAADRASLIARTLAGVQGAVDQDVESYRFRPAASRLRWSDLLSVAAVLLLASSVLWPVLSTVRDSARRAVCGANMREVAHAFGGYSIDHDDMLPMATAGFGGGTWWDVGRGPGRSNSANLYTLTREQYVGLDALACPGNPQAVLAPRSEDARDWSRLDELSYSYRVMARPERQLWGSPTQIVLVADRSPVVLRAVHGQTIYPQESSPNHGGRGQHGLLADGSAIWLTSPVLSSGDNIWLPKQIEIIIDAVSRRAGLDPIRGTEAPADRQDSFVGP